MARFKHFTFCLFMALGISVLLVMFFRVHTGYGIFMGIFLLPAALFYLYAGFTGKEP